MFRMHCAGRNLRTLWLRGSHFSVDAFRARAADTGKP
jgi:hypothetical protein